MKQLKYIGSHQPFGMVIEVEEKNVDRLLESGEYEEIVGAEKKIKEEVKDGNSIKHTKRL